jgi:hypothetical protein
LVEKAEDGTKKGSRRRGAATKRDAVPGRPGWSKNPAFEELCDVFGGGFADRRLAATWLRRHVLGRIEAAAGTSRFRDTGARVWALADLFLQEVMGMKPARIEAIRGFADKIAQRIQAENDRGLFREMLFGRLSDVRKALLGAQRKSAKDGALLFGLDEYATVWMHEDGDEWLVRDLVCIRVVEKLTELGYFTAHPEDALEEAAGAASAQEEAR